MPGSLVLVWGKSSCAAACAGSPGCRKTLAGHLRSKGLPEIALGKIRRLHWGGQGVFYDRWLLIIVAGSGVWSFCCPEQWSDT